MNLNARIERQEPRLGNRRDLRSVLHFQENKCRPFTIIVCEVNGLGFRSASMDCMVAPSFPAFEAAFPASTGMLTLTRNRIDYLPVNGGLLWCQMSRAFPAWR
jgi:hypothetical protein